MADPLVHRYEELTTPAGDPVAIDAEMVPVVHELWRLGFTTTATCQDVGEATAALRDLAGRQPSPHSDGFISFHQGYALIKMPLDDTLRLANQLLGTPFRDRLEQRWQHDSWRIQLAIVSADKAARPADAALIHLPRRQLGELAEVLADLG
jgi:hypothetical protein